MYFIVVMMILNSDGFSEVCFWIFGRVQIAHSHATNYINISQREILNSSNHLFRNYDQEEESYHHHNNKISSSSLKYIILTPHIEGSLCTFYNSLLLSHIVHPTNYFINSLYTYSMYIRSSLLYFFQCFYSNSIFHVCICP